MIGAFSPVFTKKIITTWNAFSHLIDEALYIHKVTW